MLFLVFEVGEGRYALDTAVVERVIPLVRVTAIPGAPRGIAGTFNYGGSPVPVVDLVELALGRPAAARLDTRLIVTRYATAAGPRRALGLVAEHVTTTIRREADDFADSGVASPGAPYLGPVTADARGLIQRIDIRQLLTAAVADVLFTDSTEKTWPSSSSSSC